MTNMKMRSLISAGTILLFSLLFSLSAAAAETVTYRAQPGGKLRIDGTSTIHDWTVESSLIGGSLELESNFPLTASATPPPKTGQVNAKANVLIRVSSLKSGKPSMDSVMHAAMKEKEYPQITYVLKQLSLKSVKAGEPLKFDSVGLLTISGFTRPVEMEVTIEPVEKGRLKVVGQTQLKMTDFGIQPPAPTIGAGLIKTADDVKITFEWLAVERAGN